MRSATVRLRPVRAEAQEMRCPPLSHLDWRTELSRLRRRIGLGDDICVVDPVGGIRVATGWFVPVITWSVWRGHRRRTALGRIREIAVTRGKCQAREQKYGQKFHR